MPSQPGYVPSNLLPFVYVFPLYVHVFIPKYFQYCGKCLYTAIDNNAISRAVDIWSSFGNPDEFSKFVPDNPISAATRVIKSAKFPSCPPFKFSASTRATSFALSTVKAFIASSTRILLPAVSPNLTGSAAAADLETIK